MRDAGRVRSGMLGCTLAMACAGCVPAAMSGAGADGPGAAASESVPSRLIARGTEPFWAIEVDGDRLVWKTPDRPEGSAVPAERRATATGFRYVARDAEDFELTITPGRCSDGMSDLVYPYAATWTHGGRTWNGCALPRE